MITAHPSTQGFTHQIAARLRELSEKNGDTIEILDLYTTDLKQDYLRYEDRREMGKDQTTKALQEKIMQADELVFVAPMWWGDVPAIMKNFIDCNFTSGFAFQYIDGKPIGLLKGKTARIIMTS
jgi:NAD(P)H dehydrogenase (quinone)